MFGEAGLEATLQDPLFGCFDRLYNDALRRMAKFKACEERLKGPKIGHGKREESPGRPASDPRFLMNGDPRYGTYGDPRLVGNEPPYDPAAGGKWVWVADESSFSMERILSEQSVNGSRQRPRRMSKQASMPSMHDGDARSRNAIEQSRRRQSVAASSSRPGTATGGFAGALDFGHILPLQIQGSANARGNPQSGSGSLSPSLNTSNGAAQHSESEGCNGANRGSAMQHSDSDGCTPAHRGSALRQVSFHEGQLPDYFTNDLADHRRAAPERALIPDGIQSMSGAGAVARPSTAPTPAAHPSVGAASSAPLLKPSRKRYPSPEQIEALPLHTQTITMAGVASQSPLYSPQPSHAVGGVYRGTAHLSPLCLHADQVVSLWEPRAQSATRLRKDPQRSGAICSKDNDELSQACMVRPQLLSTPIVGLAAPVNVGLAARSKIPRGRSQSEVGLGLPPAKTASPFLHP